MEMPATALEALSHYQGMTPEAVIWAEGLNIQEAEMPAHWEAALIGRHVFLPPALASPQRAWLLARCLGHWFLHSRSTWILEDRWPRDSRRRREAEAWALRFLTTGSTPSGYEFYIELPGGRESSLPYSI